MKSLWGEVLAIGALLATTPASAGIFDYVYVSNGATPQAATFQVNSAMVGPFGARIYTTATDSYGTLDGASYDFNHLYFSDAQLGGGVFNGTSSSGIGAAINFLGDPLFKGSPLYPSIQTGSFLLYANQGGATPRTNPTGTLTVFHPTNYDFEIKGTSANAPLDITFQLTSEPQSYSADSFTVSPVFLTIDGVSATAGVTFLDGGGFEFNTGRIGVDGVNYPAVFSGAKLFGGPLYNANFNRGQYTVTTDLAGDLESDTLTITRFGSSALPEPASWLMLIGGFGAVGALARRRGGGYARFRAG